MKMSPIDLVTTILVKPNVYPSNVDRFYRSLSLEQLLNVVNQDKRGTKKLFAWFDRPGMDPLRFKGNNRAFHWFSGKIPQILSDLVNQINNMLTTTNVTVPDFLKAAFGNGEILDDIQKSTDVRGHTNPRFLDIVQEASGCLNSGDLGFRELDNVDTRVDTGPYPYELTVKLEAENTGLFFSVLGS
jgi:hypothetical protein